jgi:hypothetical protein
MHDAAGSVALRGEAKPPREGGAARPAKANGKARPAAAV